MILSILLAIVFFYGGIFVSFAGFLFPFHMIRTILQKDKKEALLIHGIVYLILLITAFSIGADRILMMIFIGIYAIIELIYILLKKYNLFGTFDKINISSIIATVFVFLLYFYYKETFHEYFEMLKIFNKEQMSHEFFAIYYEVIEKYALYILFIYIFIMTGITYVLTERKNIPNWEMSYIYLVLYIVFVVISDIFKIKNIYMENAIAAIRFVYMIYGIKVAFYYLKRKVKYKFLIIFTVIVITKVFPLGTFIVGALGSFNLKLSLGKISSN